MVADLFFPFSYSFSPFVPVICFLIHFFFFYSLFSSFCVSVYLSVCEPDCLSLYFFSLNYRIEKDRVNTGSSLSLPFSNSLSFTFFLNMYISRVYISIFIFLCVCMGVMVPSFRYICVISPCRAFNIVYLFFVFFLLFDVFLFFFLTIALPHLFAISS